MDLTERAALERDVERSLRRGDFGDAIEALRAIVGAFPDDAAARARLSALEADLQPQEVAVAEAAWRAEHVDQAASPAAQAEQLAARGDFDQAIAIYRQLIGADASADLIRERLGELLQLAQAKHRHPPLDRARLLEHLLERISTRKRA